MISRKADGPLLSYICGVGTFLVFSYFSTLDEENATKMANGEKKTRSVCMDSKQKDKDKEQVR